MKNYQNFKLKQKSVYPKGKQRKLWKTQQKRHGMHSQQRRKKRQFTNH